MNSLKPEFKLGVWNVLALKAVNQGLVSFELSVCYWNLGVWRSLERLNKEKDEIGKRRGDGWEEE